MELSDMPHFEFHRAPDADGAAIVVLRGELDISNVDQLRPELQSVIDSLPARLIIDCSELMFFDSSGIALLVEASKKIALVQVRNPPALIARVIEATGLSNVLRVIS
jgi:anti-sigma B factor antagonist